MGGGGLQGQRIYHHLHLQPGRACMLKMCPGVGSGLFDGCSAGTLLGTSLKTMQRSW